MVIINYGMLEKCCKAASAKINLTLFYFCALS